MTSIVFLAHVEALFIEANSLSQVLGSRWNLLVQAGGDDDGRRSGKIGCYVNGR